MYDLATRASNMTKKVSKIKSMADLETGDCRWPIGDPRHADFHFCGEKQAVGRPYCAEHWHQSFVPGKARHQPSQPKTAPTFTLIRAA